MGAVTVADQRLTPGVWWVDVACPKCGMVESLPLELSVVLTIPAGDLPTIKLTSKAGKAPHACNQLTVAHALKADQMERERDG